MTNYPILLALQSALRFGGLCRHCTETHWFGGSMQGAPVGWIPESAIQEVIALGLLAWNDLHTKLTLTPIGRDYLATKSQESAWPSPPPTPGPSEPLPPSPTGTPTTPSRT